MPGTNKVHKAVWLAFDFGLRGDYKGLYTWLDNNGALDCGQGFAFFKFEVDKNITSKELMAKVMKSLKECIKLSKTDRIYIICKDSTNNKIKGDFLNGSRKASPWEGYGTLQNKGEEDEGNNQRVLLDSGFWIALFEPDKEPERNSQANNVAILIEDSLVCIPWPTMYEFLNSRFSRSRYKLDQFEKFLKKSTVNKIEDSIYKDKALENLFNAHFNQIGDVSLVDEVIKLMLLDVSLKIDYFVSFDTVLTNFALANGVNTKLL